MRKPILVAVLVLAGAAAYAQTPDGETPANEGVCDELMHATPGLYGLCIAFCEAQDLDGVDMDDPDTLVNKAPKMKLLGNYRQKMQDGDPDMPCIRAPCPCWSEEQIAQLFGRGRWEEICLDRNYFDVYGYDLDRVWDATLDSPNTFAYAYAQVYDWNLEFPRDPATEAQCWWVNKEWDFTIDDWAVNEVVAFDITQEEGESCRASVKAHAAASGIVCTVEP